MICSTLAKMMDQQLRSGCCQRLNGRKRTTELRIFCIQPGSSTSTADVHTGLIGGLKELGHEIFNYQLDTRIARAGHYLNFCWKEAKKKNPDVVEPNTADILFLACGDSIVKAMWRKPDWVIVVSAMYYPKLFLKMLKQAGLRVALLFTESPYDDEQQFTLAPIVDMCWTNERTSVQNLRICNPKTYYLAHAYDPARHAPAGKAEEDVPSHDVIFVGTGFQERVELFESINWDGIDLGIYGAWELINPRSKLKQYVRDDVIGNHVAAALYRKAKIGLNLYRTSKGFGSFTPRISFSAESMNPRAYELAACGCFHFSDYRAEVPEVFGDAVPTFKNPAELEKLIRYWLEHKKDREAVAAKLPQLVEGQTWLERAGQMVSDLERNEISTVRMIAPALARR
jgi:spore maturation protein CgeB